MLRSRLLESKKAAKLTTEKSSWKLAHAENVTVWPLRSVTAILLPLECKQVPINLNL